jgi:hypothetical protein
VGDIQRANAVVVMSRKCPQCIKATELKLSIMAAAEKAARTDRILDFCPLHLAVLRAAT